MKGDINIEPIKLPSPDSQPESSSFLFNVGAPALGLAICIFLSLDASRAIRAALISRASLRLSKSSSSLSISNSSSICSDSIPKGSPSSIDAIDIGGPPPVSAPSAATSGFTSGVTSDALVASCGISLLAFAGSRDGPSFFASSFFFLTIPKYSSSAVAILSLSSFCSVFSSFALMSSMISASFIFLNFPSCCIS